MSVWCLVNQVARQAHNMLRLKVLCGSPQMATADGTDGKKLPGVGKEDNSLSCVIDLKQFFYLKNDGTRDLVLDVKGMNRSGGTPVILWDQKLITNHNPDMLMNQLWYEDAATSTIRTALNNFCLDLDGQSHTHVVYPVFFVRPFVPTILTVLLLVD